MEYYSRGQLTKWILHSERERLDQNEEKEEKEKETIRQRRRDMQENTHDMASAQAVIPDHFEMPTEAFDIPRSYMGDLSAVVIPEGMIKDRVRRLAHDIHTSIGSEPLALLCVLKGSYKFFTALVDELTSARFNCPHPMTVDFIRCRSYEDTQSTGSVEIIGLSNLTELKGKNVLVVDDIVDTGRTLSRLLHKLEESGVRRSWTALLVSKRVPRSIDVAEDFVAFQIPDKFIVGYGLDYNQRFRDLRHICVMSKSGIEKYKNVE